MSSACSPTASTDAGSVTSRWTKRHAAIMRQVAVADVGDDDLVAVGDQLRRKVAADEAVAAENHMSH